MISSIGEYPIYLLHSDSVPDGEVGFFLDTDGYLHEYAYVSKEDSVYHCRLPQSAQSLAKDFVRGYYTANNLRIDSQNPLASIMGELSLKYDALKCKIGRPCGGRCLPRGQVCQVSRGLSTGERTTRNLGIGAGLAAVGIGALLKSTESGQEALSKAGRSIKRKRVGKAAQQIGKGIQSSVDDIATAAARRAGKYVGEKQSEFVKASLEEIEKRGEDLGKQAAETAKAVAQGAAAEAKKAAKRKADEIASKIKNVATKEIAYLPGERKLRSKIKEVVNKNRK